jgi:hypothetical protein
MMRADSRGGCLAGAWYGYWRSTYRKAGPALMLTILLIVIVLVLLFGAFGYSRRGRRGV